ncbi:MAG: hypothetical protein COV34_02875 [Candidatus Zambryskibacteria bacterium CG10_big_fil_rev_8_21_14_0_10_42_12]|uniref:Uncharacterized protein n=1 Tax=Candidatus Zambryskibacteria bacterium CG10_big_fil_rev_8_21_14_0_10_42_12 TaxID=1975115 RepID=A0A2H0QVM0_9BACT|nr:MAG: hypothetical protein COV34_02875 [Candidatus Zambryskibacteria bacterium CG10_big_fil_rev_8_21_14_0_10_42_12]
MNKATITTIIVIMGLLLLGWLLFWRNGGPEVPVVEENDDTQIEDSGVLITAKHEFSDGTHVVAGEVNLPTPCHILNVNPVVTRGTDPDQVIIEFEVTTQAEACAQVITPTRFKVDFEAEKDAEITATWNGMRADLNLIPVAEGESLDDFEIFIKG